MATFSELLKAQREASGLSQAALAKKAGISQQSLSFYEAAAREPTWANVQRIAAALGLPCSAFLETLPPSGEQSATTGENDTAGAVKPKKPSEKKKPKGK